MFIRYRSLIYIRLFDCCMSPCRLDYIIQI
nr:MAG TPA: hypothetical protein [Caudoviricetes sp.]DAW93563.1 MAG TPA: hypothetical protein [Bacteriophage sp.]